MPPIYQERKKLEFLELKQNEMSVTDYELQFTKLSRYAPEEVATDELKRNRFERGLRLEICEKGASFTPRGGSRSQRGGFRGRGSYQFRGPSSITLGRSSGSANMLGNSRFTSRGYRPVCGTCGRTNLGECWGPRVQACYRCEKPRHYGNECVVGRGAYSTYHSGGQSSVGDNVVPAVTGRGRGRGGKSGATTAYVHIEDANQSLLQARVYAVTRHDAYVLVDPGSTCSFISWDFALKMHCGIESVGYDICVSMPGGGVTMVNTVVRACSVMICGTNML
ncbi:uncharacterized protein LOC125368719 [Ricinus communis]|uniref:uncharacterized protein LOC125368719 n=1 Tax=Ricinus communis TaxID=3988 RepID=UPI00201B20FD|nr:uncharacterized protein LOC125368719 [Ricinus communis]